MQTHLISFLSQSACCLFQSEPCIRVFERLEIEIETGRLAIRRDHSPHTDVGAREELLKLLMCYNPIWLKLGLEVCHIVIFHCSFTNPSVFQAVFGEMIEVRPQHSIPQTLALYIQSRLLANSQIAEMYYQPNVTGHYGKGNNFYTHVCNIIVFLQAMMMLSASSF